MAVHNPKAPGDYRREELYAALAAVVSALEDCAAKIDNILTTKGPNGENQIAYVDLAPWKACLSVNAFWLTASRSVGLALARAFSYAMRIEKKGGLVDGE